MAKLLLIATLLFTCLAVCLVIADLVFSILIFKKTKDFPDATSVPITPPTASPPTSSLTTPAPITQRTVTPPVTPHTAPPGNVSTDPGFKAAAEILLKGIDLTVDPCKDFYAFSCNTFIKNNPPGTTAFGEAQDAINQAIAKAINSSVYRSSTAEQILKKVFDTCVLAMQRPAEDKSQEIHQTMLEQVHGFPMLDTNWTEESLSNAEMWQAIGYLELHYGLPTLLQSSVTVDYKNISRNALYLDQLPLSMSRDYYVKPQFISQLNNYLEGVIDAIKQFRTDIKSIADDETIRNETTKAIELEVFLAIATMPSEELRNYELMYNPYTLNGLQRAFPNISWDNYLSALLENGDPSNSEYIVEMPTYFGTLNTYLEGKEYSKRTFVNFLMIKFIADNLDYLGNGSDSYTRLYQSIRESNGQSSNWQEAADYCVSLAEELIPYASGYVYLDTINESERNAVRADVSTQLNYVINAFLSDIKTMKWITADSLQEADTKANEMVKNIGWPNWFNFSNTVKLDQYHVHYEQILKMDDWWQMQEALQHAYQLTENVGILEKKPERDNFLQSPALFNAWYQPDFNSITFPYAAFNPPSYGYGYPQAYNYAGQGGTAGHELTHGFDDEGVQFNSVGELKPCTWDHCGWLDTKSAQGFNDMAQCVVSQYSEQCCPVKNGSVRCASGERTQGENIADIGGLLAAYNAYRRYIAEVRHGVEEDRLPGLEQFSLNQIFWISYAYSWCANRKTSSLVSQLLTNPHAPGICRVNQVMQDIPQFGEDFGCPIGSPMYPSSDQRCYVWTGK